MITAFSGWVYGLILSYGSYVEVISPEHLRKKIGEIAASIADSYPVAN